jgi:hypothetical protein
VEVPSGQKEGNPEGTGPQAFNLQVVEETEDLQTNPPH